MGQEQGSAQDGHPGFQLGADLCSVEPSLIGGDCAWCACASVCKCVHAYMCPDGG